MNKSKFLKKSLAALLAILMVVAVIPLSAAASEESSPTPEPTPEPVALLAPTVTVNNRNAEKPENAEGSYSATVEDATTVSIAWVPETDVTAKLRTKREVEVTLPFYRLDLTQEADLVNYDEATKVSTYQVTLIFQKGEEEAVEYPLVITSRTEAASDDVTLKTVKANQSFQIGPTTYTFSGIKGEFTGDEEITITLPLGWDGEDAGFKAANFGGSGITGSSQEVDQLVSRVFVPTASYSTVRYTSAGSGASMTGRVTVTARDGRSKNYTVKFVQEAALDNVKVILNNKTTTQKTFEATSQYLDTDNNWNYVVPVDSSYYTTTASDTGVIEFGHGDNVVRVEDPSTTTAGTYDASVWADTHTSEDEPILSGKNTFVFNTNTPGGDTATIGGKGAYMTVKTEANMATNSANVDAMKDNDNNGKFYANVRIVLVDKNSQTTAPTGAPKLYELQLNGYESIWARGEEIGTLNKATGMREITVNVDNEFKYGNGDDVHPARISLLADENSTITIPAQSKDNSSVNPYWVIDPVAVTSAATGYGNYGRLGKPSVGAVCIDNVNTEGRSFVLRVAQTADANSYTEYLVKINQPKKNEGVNIPKARLWYYNTTTDTWTSYEATKSATGNNFQFELPEALYNMTPVPGTPAAIQNPVWTAGVQVLGDGTPVGNTVPFNVTATVALTTATDLNDAIVDAVGDVTTTGAQNIAMSYANGALELSVNGVVIAKTGSNADNVYDLVSIADTTAKIGTVTFSGTTWDNTASAGNETKTLGTDTEALTALQGTSGIQTIANKNVGSVTINTVAVPGTSTLSSEFTDHCFLDLDVPHGAVVTPGASQKTLSVGTSLWGADQYGNYPKTPANYTELEEGVTTMGKWWIKNYLRKDNNSVAYPSTDIGTDKGVNTDWLYFTVTNGRPTGNVKSQVYTIRLTKKGATTPGTAYSTEYAVDYDVATSAVDDDLIYGGNTVSNSILDQSDTASPGAVPRANAPYNGTWDKFVGNNPGNIDYANAWYIGAVDTDNTYNVTESTDPVNSKAKVLTIEVPENFLVNPTSFSRVVFEKFAFPTGAKAYSVNSTKNGLTPFVSRALDDDDQQQQPVSDAKCFAFTNNDLNAWNGNNFISSNVSPGNTIYVFSQKTVNDKSITDANASSHMGDADAIYYVTVKRIADKTADQLSSVEAEDAKNQVTAYVNHSRKVVTVSVPYSYNWIGSRDTEEYDFTLNFGVNDGATLVDAYRDTAFKFRKQDPTNIWSVPQNFELADLVQQQQDLFSLSDKNLTYFVKGGELFVFNKNTGSETQITGMGNGVDDAFINRAWGLIKTREAELRVYPETRANVNTYKLELNINDPESEARITGVMVDETEAVIDEATRTIVAPMPEGYVPSDVRLSISVSGMTKIVSVNKAPYDPNSGNRYDLREPIEIVIAPEDGGAEITYTLTAKTEAEPTAEPSADPTEEPTAEPSADPSEEPSVEPSATPDIAKNYTDLDKVSSDDMRKEVVTALNLGLMNGTTPTTFAPKLTMKRYQFALVIARADLIAKDKDVTGENVDEKLVEMYPESYNFTFKDVSEKVELPAAAAAVQYCYDKGYVDGTDLAKGLFSPNAPILREQAAKIMVGWAGLDHDDTDLSDIPDGDKVSDWAKGYVKAAYEAEIIKGRANGDFDPRTALKREEGACLMVRTYEKYILNGEDNEPTPTPEPTETPEPTSEPTEEPDPTAEPTEEPTAEPTVDPTEEPTAEPTVDPTEEPTAEPSTEPAE